MNLPDQTRQRIDSLVTDNRVVLFMKGTPQQPMCGFSARAVGVLASIWPDFASFDVLQDPDVREGIKTYGNWPTIPQLYVDGELIGGSDIIADLFNSGELHQQLGLEPPDRTPPEMTITDEAAERIRAAMADAGDAMLHFSVDANWRPQFSIAPAEGNEVRTEANGIELIMDVATAQRARGARIDWVETMQGEGLHIELPEGPQPVKQMDVKTAAERLAAGEVLLVDVRGDDERAKARIEEATPLDSETMAKIDEMPKDTAIAFICHTGNRSQGAAEHYRKAGYTNVFNVAGGIEAWAVEVDDSVPRY